MTSERDFDRLAQAWLEVGPDGAPDRVVAAVLQAAQTTPQARRPMRWPLRRSSEMTRLPVAAGIAAVLIAVLGASVFMSSGSGPFRAQTPVETPTPSPASPAPSDSPLAGLPSAFASTWMSDVRPGLDPLVGTALHFGRDTVGVSRSNNQASLLLTSSANAYGSGAQIRLETGAADGGCQTGDIGLYDWAVSPSGRTLTLQVVSDACTARSAMIAGDWWKMGCKLLDDPCLGNLDAGTYKSQFIAPRVDPGATWMPIVGAIQYTVPAGWANSQDWPNELSLTPSTNFAMEDQSDHQQPHEIWVVVAPHANKTTPDCVRSIDDTVAGTVDGLMTWIAKQPALTSSAPAAITIDGHPGKWVDIRIAPTWTTRCAGGSGRPERVFFAYPSPNSDNAWMAGLADQERYRVILLDLGGGHTVGVMIDSGDPATFDDLVSQAMPIIQTFKFQ